jgi:hypothetical protein
MDNFSYLHWRMSKNGFSNRTRTQAKEVLCLRLEEPNLRFSITIIDVLVPDFIPFIDEIGLALLTLLFGMLKNRKTASSPDSMK